jgi:WD40 repeat protein
LAAELGRDEEVRYAFPDGVFWLTIGKEPAIARQQLWLAEKLGDSSPGFNDEQQGKERLSKLLVNQACLLILDDVWQAQDAKIFVDALGSHCKMLITTQDAGLITALRAVEHRLDELQDLQARVLLADWGGQHPKTLPSEANDVQEECGNLPLALSLCGAMVYDGTPWSDLLEALREADLSFIEKEQFPYYLNPNVFKALKVSVDALARTNPNWEKHYLELAVFPVDKPVPEATIQTLWQHTGGLRERHARKLLTTLERKALLRVEGEAPHRRIKLHDLHYGYLRAVQDGLTLLHNQLLEAYRQKCFNGWHTGSKDGYFFEHLAYHMTQAGQKEELRKLLLDFNWLQTKLEATNVYSLIADFDFLQDDASLRLVQEAIKLSAHILAQDKSQLASQLTGRLLSFEVPDVQALLKQIRQQKSDPWLRPLNSSMNSPGSSLLRTIKINARPLLAVISGSRRIIFASDFKTLKILDLETWAEPIALTTPNCLATTLNDPFDKLLALAVTPDGEFGIAGLRDGTLVGWKIDSGSEQFTLSGHKNGVLTVVVTPDGRYVISGSWDKTLKLWDLKNRRELHTFEGHTDSVKAVAVTPDGGYIISGSSDYTLKVWDLEKKQELYTFKGHTDSITAVTVTPNGRYAISGSRDQTIKIWDLESRKELYTIHSYIDYSDGVEALKVTPDGHHLIFASSHHTLKVWDLENKKELHTLQGHTSFAEAVAVTPDGKYAISASGYEIQLWDLSSKTQSLTPPHYSCVDTIKLTLDSRRAISMSEFSAGVLLKVWDLESGIEVNIFDKIILNEEISLSLPEIDNVNPIVTEDLQYIAVASDKKTLVVLNLQKGTELLLKGHTDHIFAVAATPDGQCAVSAASDCTAIVWDLKGGKAITKFVGDSTLMSCVISPDGLTAVVGDWSGWVHFLRLEGV